MLVACPINGPQRQMQLSFLWMNKMCLPATVVARFTSYKSVTLYYSIYEMISPPEITMKITGFGGLNCILLRDFLSVFVGILRLLLGTVVDTKIDPPGFGGGEQHPRRCRRKWPQQLMFYLGMDQYLLNITKTHHKHPEVIVMSVMSTSFSAHKWVWINTYENTIFRGMNIHKSQLFWCEQKGYYWFWHTATFVPQEMFLQKKWREDTRWYYIVFHRISMFDR